MVWPMGFLLISLSGHVTHSPGIIFKDGVLVYRFCIQPPHPEKEPQRNEKKKKKKKRIKGHNKTRNHANTLLYFVFVLNNIIKNSSVYYK